MGIFPLTYTLLLPPSCGFPLFCLKELIAILFFYLFYGYYLRQSKVIFFVFVLNAKLGNNKCFAMNKAMLVHAGQGKDFQSQIGGNCDWKFFLRHFSFFNVHNFFRFAHSLYQIYSPRSKLSCSISLC